MLSEPVTEKHTVSGGNRRVKYAASGMQGWRITMEDAHAAICETEGKEIAFFGVYDGHGGANIAKYSGQYAHARIMSDPEFAVGNYEKAIKNGFLGVDEDIRKDPKFVGETSGCTAVTLIVTEKKLYCGNAGDSRCVLSKKGVAIPLSRDHKPQNKEEVQRITEAGGFVQFGRVNGNLALSRAFGDFEFKKNTSLPPEKQVVTCDPEIMSIDISEDVEFIVLACDGIWDVMNNQQVVNFVRELIVTGVPLGEICERLMDRCLASDASNGIGCDNMTVIIVELLEGLTEEDFVNKVKKQYNLDANESLEDFEAKADSSADLNDELSDPEEFDNDTKIE